jgi:uncharacterized protein
VNFWVYCSKAFNAHARPQHDPQFLEDQHEVVKPGQIVKAKVIDVDLNHQRIALTMRLEDAASRPSGQAQPESQSARDSRGRGPSLSSQAARAAQPIGAMALVLAKTRQKS